MVLLLTVALTSNLLTSLIHSIRLRMSLEWAWLNLLLYWTSMHQQGSVRLQIPRVVLVGMIGVDIHHPIHFGPWAHLPFLSSQLHLNSPWEPQPHFQLIYQAQTQSLRITSQSILQFLLGLRSLMKVLGMVPLATAPLVWLRDLIRLVSNSSIRSLVHTHFPMAYWDLPPSEQQVDLWCYALVLV